MAQKKLSPVLSVLILLIGSSFFSPVSHAAIKNEFGPLRESTAYAQFKMRPLNDLSRLIYLIDRFSDTGVEIIYDGNYFKAKFAGRIAMWFLSQRYRKETPEQWIMRWCNVSIPANNLIWVKMPSGKVRLAREVLMDELKALGQAVEEDHIMAVIDAPRVTVPAAIVPAVPAATSTLSTATASPLKNSN